MNNKQKVLKKFPNAKLYTSSNGYFIGYESDEGITNLLAEFYLPNQITIDSAWESALISVKTQQNFNRTHPIKTDMYSALEKQDRIEKRKNKSKISKEKLNDRYIYF